MRAGTLVPSDMEKIMTVNASTSVFAGQTSLQEYQDSWKGKENLEKGKLILPGGGTHRKQHLNKLNIYNPVGSPGRHPQVLRELSDVTARILLVIFEKAVVIRTESQGLEERKYQSYQ